MIDIDISDNGASIEDTTPQNDDLFHPNLSLVDHPHFSEKYNDSEDENLQMQTIQRTFPSVVKQSFINSFFDPFFSKQTSIFRDSFYLLKLHSILRQNEISKKRSCSENCIKMIHSEFTSSDKNTAYHC